MLDMPTGLRWLYLDLNSYFASVEQQLNPALRGKPVAVVPTDTSATCAIAASYEAKAFGIKTGTMIYDARKLCPELITVPARHDKYVDYHHRIMDEINRHIPITKVCSIDEVACRLMGRERDPNHAHALAQTIKRGIQENVGVALKSSVGIGPNRFLAKVASNLQKPDGLTLLEACELPGRLLHLKLRDLPGIGSNMERRLAQAGINDIESFWNLEPKHARRLWHSVQGERFWYALRGVEVENHDNPTRRTVGHSHVLAPKMRPCKRARMVARRLTVKAASRLRRLEFCAKNFNLHVRYEGSGRWQRDVKTLLAQDNTTFLNALDGLWEDMIRTDRPTRIKQISVSFYDLVAKADIMEDMFERLDDPLAKQQNKNNRLSSAMDHINKKYGLDTVVLGALPQPMARFSGTKIAFTRIPEKAEFHE